MGAPKGFDSKKGRNIDRNFTNFFSRKYKVQKYLAYFQAYTNTYAPIADLITMYEQALEHEDVLGLVIATRPDSIKDEVLDYLENLAYSGVFIKLEFKYIQASSIQVSLKYCIFITRSWLLCKKLCCDLQRLYCQLNCFEEANFVAVCLVQKMLF